MSNCISDQKFTRKIDHLTQYLPEQAELNGQRQGASYYRQVNGKSFIEAYKIVFKQVGSLTQKFNLTHSQREQILLIQEGLIKQVKRAFDGSESMPANLDNFIELFDKRTG